MINYNCVGYYSVNSHLVVPSPMPIDYVMSWLTPYMDWSVTQEGWHEVYKIISKQIGHIADPTDPKYQTLWLFLSTPHLHPAYRVEDPELLRTFLSSLSEQERAVLWVEEGLFDIIVDREMDFAWIKICVEAGATITEGVCAYVIESGSEVVEALIRVLPEEKREIFLKEALDYWVMFSKEAKILKILIKNGGLLCSKQMGVPLSHYMYNRFEQPFSTWQMMVKTMTPAQRKSLFNAQDKQGRGLIEDVCEKVRGNQFALLQLFHQYGASFEMRNNKGETPLHIANKLKHYRLVQFLLYLGADPTSRDHAGRTAIDWKINYEEKEKELRSKWDKFVYFTNENDRVISCSYINDQAITDKSILILQAEGDEHRVISLFSNTLDFRMERLAQFTSYYKYLYFSVIGSIEEAHKVVWEMGKKVNTLVVDAHGQGDDLDIPPGITLGREIVRIGNPFWLQLIEEVLYPNSDVVGLFCGGGRLEREGMINPLQEIALEYPGVTVFASEGSFCPFDVEFVLEDPETSVRIFSEDRKKEFTVRYYEDSRLKLVKA